jgi:hypothetical protein
MSVESYKNIKNSLKGLVEILKLNYDEDHFLFNAGMDNIIALGKNIPDLIDNSQNSSKIINKFKKIDFESNNKKKKSEITT